MTHRYVTRLRATALGISALAAISTSAQADQVILDDLIVDGSICVGNDCVNGEAFGFDTIRLKENNLRIRADDTSNSASFPSNDWQITFNDSTNGGANRFSIDDITSGRTPLTVEAGAPSNALYVDDGGRIGLGTASPVVEMHIQDGDSPTLRLEQDGSSGFTAQTWDVAGNETNFFVRDVTNGSTLPLRVFPKAPTNSLAVEGTTGDIGIGTNAPTAPLHVRRTNAPGVLNPQALFENANASSAQRHMLSLQNNGTVYASLIDTSVVGTNVGQQWNIFNAGGLFKITTAPGGIDEEELTLDVDGNLTISGGLITTGGGGDCTSANPCDAVFDPKIYSVPSIEDHAAEMWENGHLPAVGPTSAAIPINMTQKMLRMLNELEHAHIYIDQLNERIKAIEANEALDRG